MVKAQPELVTLGETMVMFAPDMPGPLRYAARFDKGMAGAESNVAIAAARLGVSTGWISVLGADEFGYYIRRELMAEGVDVSHVTMDSSHPTGLMFKQMQPGGETEVLYYRRGSAASHMGPGMLEEPYFENCRILHLTGITPALSESCSQAAGRAMEYARRQGARISFDPNIRLKLWSAGEAARGLEPFIRNADILLPGLDECAILLEQDTPEGYVKQFLSMGVSLVALKLGAEGAVLGDEDGIRRIPPWKPKAILDPVGAGDAFAAGFLSGLLEGEPPDQCARRGNLMGALALQSYGDYQSLPDKAELNRLLGGDGGRIYR